jgi:hypothetical protein
MYNELKLELIVETLATLHNRIAERFPGSGLSKVAQELHRNAVETEPILEQIRRPNLPLRIGIGIAVALIVVPLIALLLYLPDDLGVQGISGYLQAIESATQDVIFVSLAIYFLVTLESRLKRQIALRALHRLRTIVHIVDMHQLTKDPEHLLTPGRTTRSSPKRTFTRFELSRYLEYCSELMSLSSKLAALHVQYANDPVILDAVNDIEVLASDLSNKMWQKIVILDTAVAAEAP